MQGQLRAAGQLCRMPHGTASLAGDRDATPRGGANQRAAVVAGRNRAAEDSGTKRRAAWTRWAIAGRVKRPR
eukprot:975299-Prymnesium_polylepis.1